MSKFIGMVMGKKWFFPAFMPIVVSAMIVSGIATYNMWQKGLAVQDFFSNICANYTPLILTVSIVLYIYLVLSYIYHSKNGKI